jgi:predicted CXXCH cytochrome family protein
MLHLGRDDAPNCTTCHEPHAAAELKLPAENNALCLQCHKEFQPTAALSSHTGHGSDPIANAGARCVECHMPRIVAHAGSQKLRSHTFWYPHPAGATETKSPDACLICHGDKDSAWSLAAAEKIWPARSAGRSGR